MKENIKWGTSRPRQVLAALLRIGWRIKRQKGSHRTLGRAGWPDYIFAYHDKAEIGPVALAKLGKKTGLTPDDL
jgi:predicted RNA binding protein YcfA (HicA-like mRNA interferase family)